MSTKQNQKKSQLKSQTEMNWARLFKFVKKDLFPSTL